MAFNFYLILFNPVTTRKIEKHDFVMPIIPQTLSIREQKG